MGKETHRRVTATEEQRQLASQITHARRYEKEWGKEAKSACEKLQATLDDEVDIMLVTETHDEVADIAEISKEGYDYARFFADNPHLKAELEADYKKAPTVYTQVSTKWVESGPAAEVG